ncbi:hypothetical protein [Senimuribacter intestinalis]|uniref:hypothetical protein n=1 Tax=Senimuribacter intestinalis TaxID=2941507 RepID=UPI00203D843F|nr:hypothetical protein [Senimuribacter intestinalis]
MEQETAQMIEEKRRFVKGIEFLLSLDKNSMVDSLIYKFDMQDEAGEVYDEYVGVAWETGGAKKLLVTGYSNGAILKEIIKEVY